MDQITLEEPEQLHKIFRAYRSHNGFGSWFRGQTDINWPLLPKAGRDEYFLPDHRDLGRFNDWRNQAIAYSDLPSSNIECLAIAQHHGLATRLLDWTQNPLVATYFSVNSDNFLDGAIYILESENRAMLTSEVDFEVLKEIEGVVSYIPRSISSRVLNQKGMFTVHSPANKKIDVGSSIVSKNSKNLIRVIVPQSIKPDILKMLDDYGINDSMLFPDLDGLSRHKNRETMEMVKYKKT